MAADPGDPILAFLLGRTVAEQLGLSASHANQWGGVQAAFGLNAPGLLVVHELARRDALEQAAQSTALRHEIQALHASVLSLGAAGARTAEAVQRTEQAALQSTAAAEGAARAAEQAAARAAETGTAVRVCCDSCHAARTAAAQAAAHCAESGAAVREAIATCAAARDAACEAARAAARVSDSAERAVRTAEEIVRMLEDKPPARPPKTPRKPKGG